MTPLLSAPAIPAERLLWLAVPLAIVWVILRSARNGDDRRLLHGIVRGGVQLSLIGYVLVPLFTLEHDALVLAVICGMCCLAALFSLGVLGKGPGLRIWPLAVMSILPVVVGLVLFALTFVVKGTGALEARYAITLAGMLSGNAMNAVAIAGERFLAGLSERRAEIEGRLMLGATGREATAPLLGAALKAATAPSINSLIAVGLVSFPGTMTGQVMAGEAPLPAAVWQMMIMGLWVGAATFAPRLFLHLLQGAWLHGHRIAEERSRSTVHTFEIGQPLPAPAEPSVFDERPPDELTRGFIGRDGQE
ncbi:MAG: hypothetical protein CMJ83_02060 [Planctomycetes bacterium]|nr:hypothetical protein [Planctomycetota bacterium]